MGSIPWGKYFEMTADGEHVLPEAYEVLESLLAQRGLFHIGWSPATRQSCFKIVRDSDVEMYETAEALADIMPHRKPVDGALCAVAVSMGGERDDCAFSLLMSQDLEYIELRQQVYCTTRFTKRLPSIEFALTYIAAIPPKYWDDEEVWDTLFPALKEPTEQPPCEEEAKALPQCAEVVVEEVTARDNA